MERLRDETQGLKGNQIEITCVGIAGGFQQVFMRRTFSERTVRPLISLVHRLYRGGQCRENFGCLAKEAGSSQDTQVWRKLAVMSASSNQVQLDRHAFCPYAATAKFQLECQRRLTAAIRSSSSYKTTAFPSLFICKSQCHTNIRVPIP